MKKIFIIGLVAILASVSIASASPNSEVSPMCPQEIVDAVIAVKADFYIKIEPQMESADLPSERIADMFKQFHSVENEMRKIMKQRVVSRKEITQNSGAFADCRAKIRGQIQEVSTIFLELYKQVSARKRNYLLLEKYDHINDKLKDLQEELHYLRSSVNSFHDRLPCFISNCL